jgi:HSP20 family molecular chaperone IbpA
LKEVTLTIPCPPGTNKRTITVTFKPSHLLVRFKGQEKPIIDGDLHKRVKAEDSTWYLEDGKLRIELPKVKTDEWWSCVCVGDAQIDTSKIKPEDSQLG